MNLKTELRRKFRALLKEEVNSHELAQATAKLNKQLIDLLSHQSGVWAAYQPTGFEPDIRDALTELRNITWVFPRVAGESMSFYQPHLGLDHPSEVFTLNQWGILEPDLAHATEVKFQDIRGLLIPGLVFDSSGARLGRGGGYYDRTLARLQNENPNAIKIGIAFDRQIHHGSLPIEPFDIPVDWVLTGTQCLSRAGGSGPALSDLLSERKTS